MNNTEKWQLYLYNSNIICHKCFQSGAITCDKCKDAVNRHVMSGQAVGWEEEEDEEREEVREPQIDWSDRD